MNKEIVNSGFSSKKEEVFLGRLTKNKRINLEQELKTQLAEDFGLLEFSIRYGFDENGNVFDALSGEKVASLTERGGIDQETISIRTIENGLRSSPNNTWIHFSPENRSLGYPNNCVDFWRVIDKEVVWNRMVIKEDFDEMNTIRSLLSGEKKAFDEAEILGLPISVDLKMAEIFNYFELGKSKNVTTFEMIKRVVEEYLDEFDEEFGEELTRNSDLIFRLYSACFEAIRNNEELIDRRVMENYMYSALTQQREEKSFGCSATTMVGVFGEKIGYYVSTNGQVKYGEIPENYKECEHCGCWYLGDKCPFC